MTKLELGFLRLAIELNAIVMGNIEINLKKCYYLRMEYTHTDLIYGVKYLCVCVCVGTYIHTYLHTYRYTFVCIPYDQSSLVNMELLVLRKLER